MNEIDKQLKEALAENGAFDPEKAAALKKTIIADFDAKMRKVERYVWLYLIIFLIFMGFAVMAFARTPSNDTRSLIVYAILFLVGYESTILIKLWYWIANMKVTMLKEIKLLLLAQPSPGGAGELAVTEGRRRPGLSRWERLAWLAAIVVGGGIVGGVLPAIGAYEADSSYKTYVTLDADGSGTSTAKMRFRNVSQMPMTSLEFHAPAGSEIQWLDQQGEPLVVRVTPEGDRSCYTVEIPWPLLPGEWFSYTRITKSSAMAQMQKDGLWVYRADESYGLPSNDFAQWIFLPEGVQDKDVSLQVQGEFEHACKNGRRIFLTTNRGSNEPFKFTVEYRLPSDEKNEDEIDSAEKEVKITPAESSNADSEVAD